MPKGKDNWQMCDAEAAVLFRIIIYRFPKVIFKALIIRKVLANII